MPFVDGLRRSAQRHPVATYVVLAYVVSWACWVPLLATGSIVRQGDGWPTDLPVSSVRPWPPWSRCP